MPLANKNNALIVKNGKIAEDCNCCGGWYCCPSPNCISSVVQAVTVTISAEDYLKQSTYSLQCTSASYYEYASVGFLGSAFSGAFSLTKLPNGEWRYDFPATASNTCSAYAGISWGTSGVWQLTLSYPIVAYVRNTQTPDPLYKELSALTCTSSGFFGQLAGDCFSGLPLSRGPNGTVKIIGSFAQCGLQPTVGSAYQNNNWTNISLSPSLPVTFQPAFPGKGTTVKETGTNSATISVSFS